MSEITVVAHQDPVEPATVVYLMGAGASHGCANRVSSPYGLLMADLNEPLSERMHELVQEEEYKKDASLVNLVNTIAIDQADFEHVVTFLDESPSSNHQAFASDLRRIFEGVLRDRLEKIKNDLGEDPVGLYSSLFDMYNLVDFPERLGGILTTNYDLYIEKGLEEAGFWPIDFGFPVRGGDAVVEGRAKLVKLHGSFGWAATWPPSIRPLDTQDAGPTLWIPPGIQKPKHGYPFNVLWGFARELLACDVLRVIGCRLDGNDWDLIALLFSSLHARIEAQPYRVEVIDAPSHAQAVQGRFPYLSARSLLELEDIGPQLIAEYTVGEPRAFDELDEAEQKAVIAKAGTSRNWFEIWLRQQAEFLNKEGYSLETPLGLFKGFLES